MSKQDRAREGKLRTAYSKFMSYLTVYYAYSNVASIKESGHEESELRFCDLWLLCNLYWSSAVHRIQQKAKIFGDANYRRGANTSAQRSRPLVQARLQ